MLERQEIRLATVAVLSGRTAAQDRVYPTPILPWRRELPLPAIGVYTLDESGEALDGGLNVNGMFAFRYTLQLAIEVVVPTPVDATLEPAAKLMIDSAATLDALCEEVVTTLLRSPGWYTRWNFTTGQREQRFEGVPRFDTHSTLGRVEDTDQRTMAAQLVAQVTYTCAYPPPVEDDFCRVCLDVDVIDPACDPNIKCPGPDGRIEVELEIPRPGVDPPLCDHPPPAPGRRSPHPEREPKEDSPDGD